jgi:RHS repeat-associated protein
MPCFYQGIYLMVDDASLPKPKRYYYMKDHLGSIRVTVDQTGEIVSYDDYDAWGMQLSGRSNNLSDENDKYKFVGNERDVETGYDYLGHRYYDSRIGKLLSVDPFESKYPSLSSYSYAANNPIMFYDAGGDSVWINYGNERVPYTGGMEYTGTNKFIASTISALNSVYGQKGGKDVITSLVGSSNNYSYYNGGTSTDGAFFAFSSEGGRGGNVFLNKTDVNTVAEETFHGYVNENKQGGETLFNEIQAKAFASIMDGTNSYNNGGNANDPNNKAVTSAFNNYINKPDYPSFYKAINTAWNVGFYGGIRQALPNQNKHLLRMIFGGKDDFPKK